MKKLNTVIFLVCISLMANSKNNVPSPTYQKLCEVNAFWKSQCNPAQLNATIPAITLKDERAMIKTHLQIVEDILRARDVSHHSKAMQLNRIENLNHLHAYWQKGAFPINIHLSYRNPIFIDEFNNFCAVGYLIKASGHEDLSRMIAAKNNLAYLHQMRFDELNAWVSISGLTLDELAWIQPGYPNMTYVKSIGKGTNGTVYSLANDVADVLYIGGSFSMVNGTNNVSNIASYTKSTQSWTSMGSGFNGTVRKLFYHNVLYAGGSFTKSGSNNLNGIAVWNGTSWESIGTINGTVYDIALSKDNNLYIAGDFTFEYQSKTYSNLASWDGTNWVPAVNSINGTVRTIATNGSSPLIYFGGDFTLVNDLPFNHIALLNGKDLDNHVGGGVPLPVTSLVASNDSIYACGEIANETDTFGFAVLANNEWANLLKPNLLLNQFFGFSNLTSFDNLSKYNNKIVLSGKFNFSDGGFGYFSGNNVVLYDPGVKKGQGYVFSGIGFFDSTILAACSSNGGLVMGGVFKMGGSSSWSPVWTDYNSLAFTDFKPNGIQEVSNTNRIYLSPNPITDVSVFNSNNKINTLVIYDLSGKLIKELDVNDASASIEKNWFSTSGIYFAKATTHDGVVYTKKFVVE